MADIRLVEELDVDEVEDVASSEKRELVLCKLEISMNDGPFHKDFSEIQLP